MPTITYKPETKIRLLEKAVNGTNYIEIVAPDSLASNAVFVLPEGGTFASPDGNNLWTGQQIFNGLAAFGQAILITRTGTNGVPAANVPMSVWQTDGKTIGDGSIISWNCKNSVDTNVAYVQIKMEITDPTAGSEDGKLTFLIVSGGTMTPVVTIDSSGVITSLLQKAGFGPPNGVVSAVVGATYHNLSGGAGTSFYVKESNSGGNTGWVGK
jgi:hypothetical protein